MTAPELTCSVQPDRLRGGVIFEAGEPLRQKHPKPRPHPPRPSSICSAIRSRKTSPFRPSRNASLRSRPSSKRRSTRKNWKSGFTKRRPSSTRSPPSSNASLQASPATRTRARSTSCRARSRPNRSSPQARQMDRSARRGARRPRWMKGAAGFHSFPLLLPPLLPLPTRQRRQ